MSAKPFIADDQPHPFGSLRGSQPEFERVGQLPRNRGDRKRRATNDEIRGGRAETAFSVENQGGGLPLWRTAGSHAWDSRRMVTVCDTPVARSNRGTQPSASNFDEFNDELSIRLC